MNDEIRLLRGRLDGAQKNRMRKLLDMPYTPKQLAKEIGFNVRQIYFVYIPAGCPHERDERRYITINGKLFREWVEKTYKKRKLGDNQGYCRTCDKGVEFVDPAIKTVGDTDFLYGDCSICGRKNIHRIVANRRGAS